MTQMQTNCELCLILWGEDVSQGPPSRQWDRVWME